MKKQMMKSRLADLDLSDKKYEDIVKAIKEDHKDLRKFGEILTSDDSTMSEKKEAYKNFSGLLKSHAKSEEKAVYEKCCSVEDLRMEAEEGYIEHKIADGLMKNIATIRDEDKWCAAVKVLAEVVEHHADEEEKEMLPDITKSFQTEEKKAMSHEFITLRDRSQSNVTDENGGILAQMH